MLFCRCARAFSIARYSDRRKEEIEYEKAELRLLRLHVAHTLGSVGSPGVGSNMSSLPEKLSRRLQLLPLLREALEEGFGAQELP